MIKKLNARTVKALKPIAGRRMDYHDTEVRGLTLRITEKGSKSWSVTYRHRGRLRRLTLGTLKAITLADARERARDAMRSASKGGDPAREKHERKQAATIADLAPQYITSYAKPRKRSWKKDEWILKSKVLPMWKHRAIKDITRRDVRTLVQGIADGGAPIMANRTAALLSKLFRYALDEDLIETSPAVSIARPAPEQKRDRVLTDDDIRDLWPALDALEPRAMGDYYRLRLITAQRGGEVASMRWEDIDLDGAWWTIPAGRSKNKLAHRVPLSALAVRVLAGLLATADADDEFVLVGARGKRQQTEAVQSFPIADFRGHDLRRTAASLMAGGGIPRLVIGKILNHVERDITAVYDRHSYDAEKRSALDWWSLKLTAILEKSDASKVLAFGRVGA